MRTLTETAFPWIAVLASTVVGFLAVLMAFDPDQQQAIALSVLSAVIVVVTGVLVNRRHANKRQLVSNRDADTRSSFSDRGRLSRVSGAGGATFPTTVDFRNGSRSGCCRPPQALASALRQARGTSQ